MKQERNFKAVGEAEVARGVSEDCRENRNESIKLCLSPDEVSEAIGLNIVTVRKLIKAGVIPSVRCGNRYIVPVIALEEALANLVGKELAV